MPTYDFRNSRSVTRRCLVLGGLPDHDGPTHALRMKFCTSKPTLMLVAAFLWPSALAFTAPSIIAAGTTSRSRHGAMRAHVDHQPVPSAPEQVLCFRWLGICRYLCVWSVNGVRIRIFEVKNTR